MLLTSCETKSSSKTSINTVGIFGRENQSLNKEDGVIYEIDVPYDWICKEPIRDDTILDTKKPIYEFIIEEEDEDILITIYNFPGSTLEERIPPIAQINRWKQQFTTLDENLSQVSKEVFGGFTGLKFQGVGKIKGEEKMVIGWIMQLPQEHYFSINFSEKNKNRLENLRADYTIKVTGTAELIMKHHQSIEKAVKSFRLNSEIQKVL